MDKMFWKITQMGLIGEFVCVCFVGDFFNVFDSCL